ncbi:SDR family oxidoreductase [Sphingomonas nostoxanthinifaciens]|uniref:SDR family oxidoreductase n=1 Tax=Sphingomonas nostoxanthinifaciens TaxID=2872652 RepID=UPI001CC1E6DA|nr:SDR family oxidoreductase [Sphingomonas nostoxanthinifaciens]UAK25299.1 SDR family oxidoreductase [Sphingomonas nostoxanthinifaciens]
MRVFVTGATGWVGSSVVAELLEDGHSVAGLCRSDANVASLKAKGVEPIMGSLADIDVLAQAASDADAVVHTAFGHDFSKFPEHSEQDRRVIEAMGKSLVGTAKPMLVTTGLLMLAPGRVATEADMPPLSDPKYPRKTEAAVKVLTDAGVNIGVVRLAPTVHGVGDRMFMAILAQTARETGVSAYVGDGTNRWCAIHVSDVGAVYCRALEANLPMRAYHASAEEGVMFKDIAEVIGRNLGLPVESRPREHFGWFAAFAENDAPTSSMQTRKALNWQPAGKTLLEDLSDPAYFSYAV